MARLLIRRPMGNTRDRISKKMKQMAKGLYPRRKMVVLNPAAAGPTAEPTIGQYCQNRGDLSPAGNGGMTTAQVDSGFIPTNTGVGQSISPGYGIAFMSTNPASASEFFHSSLLNTPKMNRSCTQRMSLPSFIK